MDTPSKVETALAGWLAATPYLAAATRHRVESTQRSDGFAKRRWASLTMLLGIPLTGRRRERSGEEFPN